ncbi:TIGR03619 family F420-dependent LLM class oxidoreductase [Nocardioides sp. GXZ039]|uniref:TIGR03619 family F420-dependent LLM class oxidoreductase n=1 Tax=Nocardioides sp. GXZ039 TaxID=3136018 RepID=UPI0030F3D234
MSRLKIGVLAPHTGNAAGPSALREVGRAAEDLGYDSMWVGDHIVLPAVQESSYPYGGEDVDDSYEVPSDRPFLEATTSLAYLSAVTEQITLGVSVAILPYRPPAVWAKTIGTLDVLAEGRIVMGAGVGWLKEEFDVLGAEFSTRGRQVDETLRFLRTTWAQDGPVSFDGEFSRVDGMHINPSRARGSTPPVWVGGNGLTARRRTARLGDVWHPHVRTTSPALVHASREEMGELAAAAGRGDVEIGVALHCPLVLTERVGGSPCELGRVEGPPAFLADTLGAYEEAGLDHIVLTFGGSPSRRIRTLETVADAVGLSASR